METFTFTRFQFERFTQEMMEAAIVGYVAKYGKEADYMSQRAAKLKFGSSVPRWEKAKLITGVKQGGVIKYKRSELETLSRTDELYTKFLS